MDQRQCATSVERTSNRPPEFRIRALGPGDAPACRRFVARLDRRHARMRFWSVDRAVDYLIPAPVGTIRGAAFAAVARPDVILGVVNLVPMSSGTAEVAIIVRSDHQRRGIGRCLIEHAIQWGGRDGLTQIIGFIAPDNVAMLALASALQGQTIGRDRYFCTVRWRHPFERSALCRTTQR